MMMRIKEICDYVSRGSTPDYIDESPYKVMNQASFSKGYIDESKQRFTSKISQGANIRKGDLLMASTGGGVLGKVFYFDSDDESFYADSHVTIMRDSRGRNLMKYLYYAFSLKYDEINATLVKGSTNQTELQRNYLLAYELEMPSTIEQQRIVNYLDEKTKAIDARISVLEKKSDAYTRLKASVINRAVTRGLTPNVPLKDSGIEWIGMIPEHWEVKRVKDIYSRIFMGKSPVYELEIDNENYIFGQKNNQSGYIDLSGLKMGKDSFYQERQSYEFLKYGDVLLNTLGGGSVGRAGYFDYNGDKKMITDGHVMVIRTKDFLSKFLYFYLHSRRKELENMAVGSTNQAFFNISDILPLHIPYPTYDEQKEISDYLDTKCSEIDKAIDNIGKQIDALKRLKRSLINEVVTGKRKI